MRQVNRCGKQGFFMKESVTTWLVQSIEMAWYTNPTATNRISVKPNFRFRNLSSWLQWTLKDYILSLLQWLWYQIYWVLWNPNCKSSLQASHCLECTGWLLDQIYSQGPSPFHKSLVDVWKPAYNSVFIL